MKKIKTIALVAHDNRKRDLGEWIEFNYRTLVQHKLVCTGTTGRMVEEIINRKFEQNHIKKEAFEITKLKSGPLGGDQQLGGMIAEGKIDFVLFFWDPMEPQPHDVDVKALLRIAVMYNIPTASNRSTADFIISSPLFHRQYEPIVTDYADYTFRTL